MTGVQTCALPICEEDEEDEEETTDPLIEILARATIEPTPQPVVQDSRTSLPTSVRSLLALLRVLSSGSCAQIGRASCRERV